MITGILWFLLYVAVFGAISFGGSLLLAELMIWPLAVIIALVAALAVCQAIANYSERF